MNIIKELLTAFDPFKENYHILVVANLSSMVSTKADFIEHSFDGEFFSKAEFAQILSAISSIFGYVTTFFSEIDFIKYVIENIEKLQSEHILVYNFARDGASEGKKSLIPSFCDLYGLSYTGSNAFVISLLRNKLIFTRVLSAYGLSVPKTYKYCLKENSFDINPNRGKYIMKEVASAASKIMGYDNQIFADNTNQLLKMAQEFCIKNCKKEILVQEFIDGQDNECEVLVMQLPSGYFAFSPIGIRFHHGNILTEEISNSYDYSFYDFSKKYPASSEQIRNDAVKSAEILRIKTYARFDYRVDSNGNHYLIDIAGTPYAIKHSSIAFLFMEMLKLNYTDFFKLLAVLELHQFQS